MKFADAIDLYFLDMRSAGRIRSDRTEVRYRHVLSVHCDDITNRDPGYVGRNDVKTTLRRWPHPNTQRTSRAVLVSFYDWAMEEGYANSNPARMTRRPRQIKPVKFRMSLGETVAFLRAAQTPRERRVAFLGVCAGIRCEEFRGLQGRHFQRRDMIWVSADIAKGGRERWIPVLGELVAVVAEIRRNVAVDEYVVPAERWRDPGFNTNRYDLKKTPASRQVMRTVVETLSTRAGVHGHVTPHTMRHAFGDHITRFAGIRTAQSMLGHADVGTTQLYTGEPTLDELSESVSGFAFDRTGVLGAEEVARMAREARTGVEPVDSVTRTAEPDSDDPHIAKPASQILAGVLIKFRAAFLPIVREGGAA